MTDTQTFTNLPVSEAILRAVSEMGFSSMTDIQAAAIPFILGGRDIVGRSATGSGKTVAFGIPAVELASKTPHNAAVLILAPTRELAVQITGEIRKIARYTEGVSVATIYGGQPMDSQIRQLRTAKIVVGTPGRIMDHMRRRTLKLHNTEMVILDEADEMLNMGFLEDITTILSATPEMRQTLLFSATMPPAIMKITGEFQKTPQMVAVDGGQRTVSTIKQQYYVVPQARKTDTLKLLLELHSAGRCVVFCNTKKMVDELVLALNEYGYSCVGLHGDMKQSARNSVMAGFKAGKYNILIATDVAARGIDVDDIEAVFNYDIPQETEFYIHRIGRTGRAGKTGTSYTIASGRNQIQQIRNIERYIGASIKEEPLPNVETLVANYTEAFKEELRNTVLGTTDKEWLSMVQELEAEGVSAEAQAAALCALLASKDKKLAKLRAVRPFATPSKGGYSGAGKAWISIDIGSKEKIGPNFIVGALVEATGLSAGEIGKIDIFDTYTLVEVDEKLINVILEKMAGTKIKGKYVHVTRTEHTPADGGYGGSRKRKPTQKTPYRDFSARDGASRNAKKGRKPSYGKNKTRSYQ